MKQSKREKVDEMFKDAARQSLDDMINEYPSLEELDGKYEFSDKHSKRMERLFKKAKKIEENGNTDAWHRFRRLSFNAAAVICMIFTIFSLVAFTVPKMRITLSNYILTHKEDHTIINITSDTYDGEVIGGAPTYIPKRFTLDKYKVTETSLYVVYKDDKDGFIIYSRYEGSPTISLDTEDTKLEKIKIKGYDGFLVEKNNTVTILFHDTRYTYLTSVVGSREEAIKVVESIFE